MFRNVVVKNQPAADAPRLGIRLLLASLAILTLCQTAGCNSGFPMYDAAVLTYRDTVWAKRAYNLRYANCDRPYAEHYENGFQAGYKAIANGGDGFVPALPPQEYRAYEYQSVDGAKCVNGWFEGYPSGVAAAKKDKAGNYHDVMISRMINAAIEQDNTKPVLPGDEPNEPEVPEKRPATEQASDTQSQAPPQAQPQYVARQTSAVPIISNNPPLPSNNQPRQGMTLPPIVRPGGEATTQPVDVLEANRENEVMQEPQSRQDYSVMKTNEPLPMANWKSDSKVR